MSLNKKEEKLFRKYLNLTLKEKQELFPQGGVTEDMFEKNYEELKGKIMEIYKKSRIRGKNAN